MRDKVLLVSGGTQGLGAGIALAAAEQDAAAVAVVGRNAENGAETVERLEAAGTPAAFVKADLADMGSWAACWRRRSSVSAGWTPWLTLPG